MSMEKTEKCEHCGKVVVFERHGKQDDDNLLCPECGWSKAAAKKRPEGPEVRGRFSGLTKRLVEEISKLVRRETK